MVFDVESRLGLVASTEVFTTLSSWSSGTIVCYCLLLCCPACGHHGQSLARLHCFASWLGDAVHGRNGSRCLGLNCCFLQLLVTCNAVTVMMTGQPGQYCPAYYAGGSTASMASAVMCILSIYTQSQRLRWRCRWHCHMA